MHITDGAGTPIAKPPSSVIVSEMAATDGPEWDRFVLSTNAGTPFHLSGWMHVVEDVLGHRCFRLVGRRNGCITGVLPVAHVRNRLFGDCLVSLPLAVYGGICAQDEETYNALLKAGSDLGDRLRVKYLELRNRALSYPTSLPGRDLYVTFTQDLRQGPEKLLASLPRDTRYMVRKSLKGDLIWTGDITLNEFYEIYAKSVHRLGTPVFPKMLFRRILSDFAGASRLFGVRKNGTPIAVVLCLYFGKRVLPYYGGSLAEYNRDAPNNFMYWNLIADSCAKGFQTFDFGRSKRGTGSFDFKSSWGMQVETLPYQYHLVRATRVPKMSPVNPKFHLPVAAWKRLPFALTKMIGPPLIRWIPSI